MGHGDDKLENYLIGASQWQRLFPQWIGTKAPTRTICVTSSEAIVPPRQFSKGNSQTYALGHTMLMVAFTDRLRTMCEPPMQCGLFAGVFLCEWLLLG